MHTTKMLACLGVYVDRVGAHVLLPQCIRGARGLALVNKLLLGASAISAQHARVVTHVSIAI